MLIMYFQSQHVYISYLKSLCVTEIVCTCVCVCVCVCVCMCVCVNSDML